MGGYEVRRIKEIHSPLSSEGWLRDYDLEWTTPLGAGMQIAEMLAHTLTKRNKHY